MPLPLLALAAAGAAGGYLSAKSKNKKLKGMSDPLPKYSGYKPPHVGHLRPVEDQITDILMRRSRGEDVGYDPRRREALLQNFDIEQGRDMEEAKRDLSNRLSGMGLSKNAAAYDDLVGRYLRDAQREKNLYTNRIDIEDLARRNEERDINTGRLQDLNTFNFGQENKVADFDMDVYRAESGNELARRGFQAKQAEMYEDPYASALSGGVNSYFGGKSLSSTGPAMTYEPIQTSSGSGVRKDPYGNYLSQLSVRSGKNFNK